MKNILSILFLFLSVNTFGQGINSEIISLSNFLKRMYTSAPFEGVKIVEDYDHKYLLSVISLDKTKYTDPSIMDRVAQVKAQSQANTFLNGASISMEMIIKTTEKTTLDTTITGVESIESIKQNSRGFTRGLELLTNFVNLDTNRMVFMYYTEIIE